jgi:phosphoserine phosphatase RsbU/P
LSRLRSYSAGHNPLLWIHQGQVRWLDSHGMPLGILPELMDPEAGTVQLAAGDTLVLYTDGFTEAADPKNELWGEERFAAVVQAALASSPEPTGVVDALFAGVDAWAAGTPQADDLTLAVIRVG